ncbi:glycosyltransferase [Raoultella sp. RLT01]|uniref:glycosyltransferase n=1 Tax=Raoultella sp. RLT01 TaxID=2769256 RepID=UPI0017871619|nr:glycosyltransferase [Raoultella sp. RLT01]MBD9719532.1 glycosyltransferase [Raoultella sp. RLT01]
MKVVHAAETIQGGVATVLKQLALYQATSETFSSVSCVVPSNQSSQLEPLQAQYIIGFTRTGRNFTSLLSFTISLLKVLIKEKPNVLHLHSSFAGIIGRILVCILFPIIRPKVIYCPHAFSFLMSNNGKLKNKIYIAVEKILAGVTSGIICVSNYEKNQAIKDGMPEKKLHVIHNGVPVIKNKPEEILNPYNKDKINLLFIGRFDYQKGFDLLLTAMDKLNGSDFHLTAIGSSVHSDFKYDNKENITYTGWMASKDISKYLAFADCLVIPSRWEGFAMVPLEAMSFGLPIIASNATSLPEVVENNNNGLLFDINVVDDLYTTIKMYEPEKFQKMGVNGNKIFQKLYTASNMINSTMELYKDVSFKK